MGSSYAPEQAYELDDAGLIVAVIRFVVVAVLHIGRQLPELPHSQTPKVSTAVASALPPERPR